MSSRRKPVVALLGVAAIAIALVIGIETALAGNAQTILVSKNGTGSGWVTSVPQGIYCGKHCSFDGIREDVTLTATPNLGSAFRGWSGNFNSNSGSCGRAADCTLHTGYYQVRVTATFMAIRCLVPWVHGKTLAAAERLIKSLGCSVGKITHDTSRTVKTGHLISENPKAGGRLRLRTKVALVVSEGH